MGQDWAAAQSGRGRSDSREAVTKLGLEYNLMTQYTSFVAVEEAVVTEGGKARRVEVPVEMPHGMSYEGVFGERREIDMASTNVRAKRAGGGIMGGFLRSAQPVAAPPGPRVELKEMEQPSRKVDPSLLTRNSGKVRVQLWVTDTSKEVMASLKTLGVEVVTMPQSGKLVIATVDASKLLEVAKLAAVRYISPVK